MCKKRKIAAGIFSILLFSTSFAETETIDAAMDVSVTAADTFFIFGNHSYGILNLPATPKGIPYLINGNIENENNKILLLAGTHHISWDGGIEFEPIDTTIEVNVGEIRDVVFNFVERKATFFLETEPEDAKIFINGELAGVGVLFGNLRAGEHKISISANGFHTNNQDIILLPNRLTKMNIQLEQIPDRDNDGFSDSIDVCPDVFGIFDGCPKYHKGKEFRKLSSFWFNYLKNQPFTIEVSALSLQYRIPVLTDKNKDFRYLISLFNDGAPIGTNYRGFSAFNKLWIANSFWIISAEYGQAFAGLKYKKPYEIAIDDYTLIYKEYSGTNPEMELFSYSGQFGIRAGNQFINIAVLTGYHREKITVSGITKTAENGRNYHTSYSKQNNSWITTVRAVVAPKRKNFHPEIFAEVSFTPISNYDVTSWISVRSGILIPWRFDKSIKN